MWSRRVTVPILLVTGALLVGAAPAYAAATCAVAGTNSVAGPFADMCDSTANPGVLNATVQTGTVLYTWQCGTDQPFVITVTPAKSPTVISRPRAATEACKLVAEVTVGPATFSATST